MKKVITILAAISIMTLSCNKETPVSENGSVPVSSKLTATIVQTKVSYTETPEMNLQPAWEVGDEIIGFGQYDFALRLPPVPEGTYEIRYGYVPMEQRGITQIYVDDIPQGIPIDLTDNTWGTGSQAKIGWVADTGDQETDNKNDKAMHNRGYMKGPDSQCFTASKTLARSQYNLLRKIVATQYLTAGEDHYIRFRSVTNNSLEFMLDYIELCPKNVYDNPYKMEDRH